MLSQKLSSTASSEAELLAAVFGAGVAPVLAGRGRG
jgi:hypothetical protein